MIRYILMAAIGSLLVINGASITATVITLLASSIIITALHFLIGE